MVIVKDRSYLITCKVLLGSFFGRDDEEAFVELREPDNFDANRMNVAISQAQKAEDNEPTLAAFREILPHIIVDHSFYTSETDKMSASAVAELILDRTDLFGAVLSKYSEEVLFTLGKKRGGK
jgi:hypothetical protein